MSPQAKRAFFESTVIVIMFAYLLTVVCCKLDVLQSIGLAAVLMVTVVPCMVALRLYIGD